MINEIYSENPDPNMKFVVQTDAGKVDFDGCNSGVPIEAKACSLSKLYTLFEDSAGLGATDQLERQSNAATSVGAPRVQWFAAEEGAAAALSRMAIAGGFTNISVAWHSAVPPCE